jgi:hypothetical protein
MGKSEDLDSHSTDTEQFVEEVFATVTTVPDMIEVEDSDLIKGIW